MRVRTVLVFGGGGILANWVARHLRPSATQPILLHKEDCDVTSAREVMLAVATHKPDLILNCAAKTDVGWCERHPESATEVNAVGAGNVAAAATAMDVPLFHISTDYVFSGKGQAKDTDVPYPLSIYGYSKYLGELAVRSISPYAKVIRLGWLYGVEYPKSAPMLAACGQLDNQSFRIFDDIKGTPSLIGDASGVVASLVMRTSSGRCILGVPGGTCHVAPAAEAVSWFEFLKPLYPQITGAPSWKVQPNVVRPSEGGLIVSSPHCSLMGYTQQRLSFHNSFQRHAAVAEAEMKKEGIQSYQSYFLWRAETRRGKGVVA